MNAALGEPPAAGGPVLAQIRDFIDSGPEQPAPVNPIRLALRAIRGRELRLLVVGSMVGLMLALLVFVAVSPAYQSSGLIRVLAREAKILYTDSDDSRLRLYDAFVTAEMNLLASRPTLDEALVHLRASADPELALPADVGQLAAMLDVRNNKGLVSVAAQSGDPALSMAVVNAVLEAYDTGHRERHRRQFAVREAELAGRERTMEERLQRLDAEYLEIGGEHDLGTLARAHVAKTAQLEVLEERLDELATTLAQMHTTGAGGADVGDVEIQRATLLDNALADMTYERARRLAHLETLRSRYQPSHPLLRDAEVEVRVLESTINERLEQIAMLGRSGALTGGGGQNSIEDLSALYSKLSLRREEVRSAAAELNGKLIRIGSVQDERLRLRSLLDETKRALDEIVVESSNDLSGTVEILSWGALPDRPIEDKRRPLAFGALVVGAGGSVVGLILLTLVAGRLRYSDDLEGLVDPAYLAAVVPESTLPGAELADAAVALRNGLDLLPAPAARVIAVAGVGPGVGTSGTAAALACACRDAGRRVLRVDADFSDTGADEIGLLDVAAGRVELIDAVRIGADEVARLALGSIRPRALGRALTLAGLRHVIDAAGARFDVVIIDAGILAPGAPSALAVAAASGGVLVVGAGSERSRAAAAMTELERHAPGRHLIIFNHAVAGDPGLRYPLVDSVPEQE